MPTGCRSVYLCNVNDGHQDRGGVLPHLLVISNVVPKIWARTNSAMVKSGCNVAVAGASGSKDGGRVEWWWWWWWWWCSRKRGGS